MKLVVTIDTGVAGAYRDAQIELPRPSGLTCSRPLAFERAASGWVAVVTMAGPSDAAERDLALHVEALVAGSRENPTWRITIEIEPDGGVLSLVAGQFGEDQADVSSMLRWLGVAEHELDGAHEKLYVSVRLPRDAHRHFLDLVEKELPAVCDPPITDESEHAIALGFTLTRHAAQTAHLISALRYAWLVEGSRAETLVELEGSTPIVRRITTLHEWSELERQLRATKAKAIDVPATGGSYLRSDIERVAPLRQLGNFRLAWIDRDRRILEIDAAGVVRSVSERLEAGGMLVPIGDKGYPISYVRRVDGSAYARISRSKSFEIPVEDEALRRVHGATAAGILITDQRAADVRVRLVRHDGVYDGPVFSLARGFTLGSDAQLASFVARIGGADALVTIDLQTFGYDYIVPWDSDASIDDLRVAGGLLVAVGELEHGGSALFASQRFIGETEKVTYLPCRSARIVHTEPDTAWVIGQSLDDLGSRYDLFEVDLANLSTTIVTSGLDCRRWGQLDAWLAGRSTILAYQHAGLFVRGGGVEPLLPLDDGEQIVSTAEGPRFAALTSKGRMLLFDRELEVAQVSSPGTDLLFVV